MVCLKSDVNRSLEWLLAGLLPCCKACDCQPCDCRLAVLARDENTSAWWPHTQKHCRLSFGNQMEVEVITAEHHPAGADFVLPSQYVARNVRPPKCIHGSPCEQMACEQPLPGQKGDPNRRKPSCSRGFSDPLPSRSTCAAKRTEAGMWVCVRIGIWTQTDKASSRKHTHTHTHTPRVQPTRNTHTHTT